MRPLTRQPHLRGRRPWFPDLPTGTDPLSDAELWWVVGKLASDELQGRDEGTPGGAAARALIIQELKRCGVPLPPEARYLKSAVRALAEIVCNLF